MIASLVERLAGSPWVR